MNFSLIALLRKGLQLDSESDLNTNGLIFEFFDGIWLFLLACYLHRLKFAWVAQRSSSFDDVEFFCWLVWEPSNVFVLFSHKFLWYRLMRFIKAIHFTFYDFCVFQPFSLARSDKLLWLLLQTNLCVFEFFLC